MKVIRLNGNDIEGLVRKIMDESRLFGGDGEQSTPKLTPDERIATYILEKLEKERPDIQHQFIDYRKNVDNVYGLTVERGVMEADLFRVDFNNQSARISWTPNGFLSGGDFGIVRVYNVHYKSDLGKRQNVIGYALKMTGDRDPLVIPKSLARRIFDKVEEQYGDIRVFKAQRRIDKGTDDESDLFDQAGQ